jgi:hypothetical protein
MELIMEALHQWIEEHKNELLSTGPVNQGDIEAAERALGGGIAPGLKRFVQQYGAVSFGCVEVFGLGIEESSHLHLVVRTQELRQHEGFPRGCVAIECLGDSRFAVCDPRDHVFEWAFPSYIGEPRFLSPDVEAYLLKRFREARE